MDPVGVPAAVADLLREVIPWTASVLIPPNWDERYIECFGFTMEDIGEEGATSLETKMRTAGMPIEDLPGPPGVPDPGHPARARDHRQADGAGRLPRREGRARRRPSARTCACCSTRWPPDSTSRRRRSPGTIQWDFPDAEPWHVVVANGSTRAEPGRAGEPTVTLRTRFEDFVDVTSGRVDPRRLAVRGRLRPKGDVRWLWRARRMFPS